MNSALGIARSAVLRDDRLLGDVIGATASAPHVINLTEGLRRTPDRVAHTTERSSSGEGTQPLQDTRKVRGRHL